MRSVSNFLINLAERRSGVSGNSTVLCVSAATQDGCTSLHAAVRSGQVDTLRVLLRHPPQGDPTVTPDPSAPLTLPAALLNRANDDGWTAAHMAAALGLKVRAAKSVSC